MIKTRQQNQAEANEQFYKDMATAMKQSAAHKDFYGSAVTAKRFNQEVIPFIDEHGEAQYSPEQSYKASCHGREDISAILLIQLPVLERLDQIKSLLWVVVIALAYIAYKIS